MRFVILLLAPWVFGIVPAHADTAPPPFELQDGYDSQLIPEGLGMRFFHGRWNSIGRGGFIATTVTGKIFLNVDANYETPYRVLVEAPRYVLLAVLMAPSKDGFIKIPWTDFVVLTLRGHKGRDPYDVASNMIYNICDHESPEFIDGGAQAFSWPSEKLIQVFKKSPCFRGIDPTNREPFRDSWGSIRFQRRERPVGR